MDITLVEQPPIRCIGIARDATLIDLGHVITETAAAVDAMLRAAGAAPHDDLVVLYRLIPPGAFRLHVGRPCDEPVEGNLESFHLPPGPAAVGVHEGPHAALAGVPDVMTAWIQAHGRRPTGASWEIYHHVDGGTEPRVTVGWPVA